MLAELRHVRTERESIVKDLKLFNFFFFNVFSEHEFRSGKGNSILNKIPASQIDRYVESPESLFVVKTALAVYRRAEPKSQTLLCFEEDMCFDEVP
jgi:hypothetical protein